MGEQNIERMNDGAALMQSFEMVLLPLFLYAVQLLQNHTCVNVSTVNVLGNAEYCLFTVPG